MWHAACGGVRAMVLQGNKKKHIRYGRDFVRYESAFGLGLDSNTRWELAAWRWVLDNARLMDGPWDGLASRLSDLTLITDARD